AGISLFERKRKQVFPAHTAQIAGNAHPALPLGWSIPAYVTVYRVVMPDLPNPGDHQPRRPE
ncbi:MAG: hypothetical protein Q7U66_03055, partial [Methylobacter sp.]|nr:hypothetical protein [Methylobacter sp.]